MRTDTKTFAANVLKSVRALGINSVRSKQMAYLVVDSVTRGWKAPYGEHEFKAVETLDAIELKLDFMVMGGQALDVHVDGAYGFSVSTADNVLVSLEATPEQVALLPQLEAAHKALFGTIGDQCIAWDRLHGHPATFDLADQRAIDVNATPEVVAAQAAYDALRDRSLASNPHASIRIVDPILADRYSDELKEDTGRRPTGHVRHATAQRYFERMEAMYGDAEKAAIGLAA
jgi:hypothetical protein